MKLLIMQYFSFTLFILLLFIHYIFHTVSVSVQNFLQSCIKREVKKLNYSVSCFYINTHLHRTVKPTVKTHNVVFYIAALVQYTDINLRKEYTAFLCPAKVKTEAHI